jgi:hypothetical protein
MLGFQAEGVMFFVFFEFQRLQYKLRTRYPPEIDATQLQQILKTFTGGFNLGGLNGGPSLDLCRALLALRDSALGGRLSIEHVPALIGLLKFWKASFRRCGPCSSAAGTISRGIWSTKVSSYWMSMARLHLAHGMTNLFFFCNCSK